MSTNVPDNSAPSTVGTCSIDPATDVVIANWPLLDDAGLEHRVAKAAAAFASWRDTPTEGRALALARLGGVFRRRSEDLAALITREMGKPFAQAQGEVAKCAALCDWYATHGPALLADQPIELGEDGAGLIRHEPLGIVVGVMPWNFPLWQVLRAAVPITMAVRRLVTQDGRSLLGRIVPAEAINMLLDKLGLGDRISLSPDQLIEAALGGKVVPIDALSGASIKRSRVNGEQRLEVLGFDPRALASWKAKGCFTEIIQYQTRLFMPVSNVREIVAKLAA